MANGNPFYVRPGRGVAQELAGLGAILGEQRKEREAQELAQRQQNEALAAYRSGDPSKMAEAAIRNPRIADLMNQQIGAISTQQKQEAASFGRELLTAAPEQREAIYQRRIESINARGGDPRDTMQSLADYRANPEGEMREVEMVYAGLDPQGYKAYQTATGAGATDVAGIKEFEYLTEGLSPEEKQGARRVKLGLSPRASTSAEEKAAVKFAEESAKLSARLKLEPEVAGAVTAAKNQAKVESDQAQTAKSNESAWNVYSGAMDNLAQAMRGTATGPFVGFLPAVTANAQIAEGAQAVMAPVLKQMFRSAGEGTFTDKDQDMLMKMVPTRNDTPEARESKIKAIDAIVRAKLGISEEAPAEAEAATSNIDDLVSKYANP